MDRHYADYTRSPRPTRTVSDHERDPRIPITAVVNENWRGKNDPTERRRIQNRLNQRAFRQRQRAGQSPKQYKPRSMSGSSNRDDDDDSSSDEDDGSKSSYSSTSGAESALPYRSVPRTEARAISAPAANHPSGVTDTASGHVWDELAQLINRNLMAAAVGNAQHLGISSTAMQAGTLSYTPRPSHRSLPQSLTPVELQYQVAHDPIIDAIPHARLRYNILRAIAQRQIDATTFTRSIRASGSMEHSNGSWQRGGLVVWSFPEQVASWELSEPFMRRWAALLQGCEDLIAATNAWRSRRGERLFPLSLERSDVMMWH